MINLIYAVLFTQTRFMSTLTVELVMMNFVVSLRMRYMQPAAGFEPGDPQTAPPPAPTGTSLHGPVQRRKRQTETERH